MLKASLLHLLVASSAASDATGWVCNLGLVTCSQQQAIMVERFGRYHRTLSPGLHLSAPWPIESMRSVELRERPFEVPNAPAITRDNVDLTIDAVVYLRIIDPRRCTQSTIPSRRC